VTISPPLLEVHNVCKSFPGVQALQQVQLRLGHGEVLAVVGENGAGKSTLMKILGGVYVPDAGDILFEGQRVEIPHVQAATRLGITLIHQELNLAENLDIAANLFLGRESTWGGILGLLSPKMYQRAQEQIRPLGLNVPPSALVSSLTVGQKQLVEIARALSLRSRVLIMDEPTSSLTQKETDVLYGVIHDLKRQGVSILYISHRLREVEEIADRVTVLRDGKNAGELERNEIRHDAIVRLMVGRELKQYYQCSHRPDPAAPPLLQVENLRTSLRQLGASSFTLRQGEIVGMAGLIGSGRTRLAETLFGLRRPVTGSIQLNEREHTFRSPRQAIAAGVYLVPEDRRDQGLILEETVRDNLALTNLERLSRLGIVSRQGENALARQMIGELNIRTPSASQVVGYLSGGNQQKVVLGKWLSRAPRVLILDEPTRGVDVGAKREIYSLMDELAKKGVAILMISSDMEEVLGMSDRVLVMHEGMLAGELAAGQMTEEHIMQLATGKKAAS
jgi:ribose transport system ATP-binding protein